MTTRTQCMRYVVVGLSSNVTIYIAYLAITNLGLGSKLAMTLLYSVGVMQTFVLNKKWTFKHGGATRPALVRYASAYAAGYVINFLALMVLVDQSGLSHQLVQGFMIFLLAGMLFLVQKFWVFPRISSGSPK